MKRIVTATAAVTLIAGSLATASAASGVPESGKTELVVNTQFGPISSPVVSATGPLATCTSVSDLETDAVQTGPRTVLFFGTKLVDCVGGDVMVAFEATLNFVAGRKTSGSWNVVSSTLAGVASGGGQLKGDGARCEVLDGSDGCILDRFFGRVTG